MGSGIFSSPLNDASAPKSDIPRVASFVKILIDTSVWCDGNSSLHVWMEAAIILDDVGDEDGALEERRAGERRAGGVQAGASTSATRAVLAPDRL